MKEITNWNSIQEAGSYANLPAGAYLCKILSVKDVVEKNYLEIHFDILEGEYAGYFKTLLDLTGKDRGVVYKSYSDKAVRFFKAMIVAIEKSNPNFEWNWNEQCLINKLFVGNFREEDYLDQSNEIRTGIKLAEFRSTEAFKKGEVKLLAKKELSDEEKQKFIDAHRPVEADTTTDDLPF